MFRHGSGRIRFLLYAFLSRISISTSSISSQEYLAAHNKYREALEMRPLKWSNDLANFANQWASAIATQYNCEGVWHSEKEHRYLFV